MFIIIVGSKQRKIFKKALVDRFCPICNHQGLLLYSIQQWATLFLVPIFPVSRKKLYIKCPHCNNGYIAYDTP